MLEMVQQEPSGAGQSEVAANQIGHGDVCPDDKLLRLRRKESLSEHGLVRVPTKFDPLDEAG